MKRISIIATVLLVLCFVFTSCEQATDNAEGIGTVKFVTSSGVATKGLSTGDGENAVSFSQLTGHKIKLECTEGTAYCSLSGATAGFVAWPTSAVQLGYGTWTVKAEGYKDTTKYYENSTGVTFIVGPKGVSTDSGSTWGTTVSITESYCGSSDAIIKANTSLTVKNEVGTTITLGSGDYNVYTVKWYKTTTASPTTLTEVRTVSELTGAGRNFTEWTNPGTAIEQGSNTYVVVVIVKSASPDVIYGLEAVPVSSLTDGSTYTIGSGASDCVQFGKYSVTFSIPTEE